MVATVNLVAYPRNARTHAPDQVALIARSIQEYGFINPVILDKDGVIIAGHGRALAAAQLGLREVPTIQADHLTPEQVKAYRLMDNASAERAGWDHELLRVELRELAVEDYDLALTGFEDVKLVEFMAMPPQPQPPGEFPAVGEDIETEYCCPRCRYRWSGKPDAGRADEAA